MKRKPRPYGKFKTQNSCPDVTGLVGNAHPTVLSPVTCHPPTPPPSNPSTLKPIHPHTPAMVTFAPQSLSLHQTESTLALGRWLGERLTAGTVLLLQGDLGSGKTTLAKGLGQGLGITEDIDSPTFTLISEYLGGRLPFYHVDLYRLEGKAVDNLYLETYWDGLEFPPGIVAIEWAERLRHLPPAPLRVALTHRDGGRHVVLAPADVTQATLLETLTPDALLVDEV
ncbi:tRNA (adenosine(37)-N6)-threonylcarbamoyltransferase complex ATPase subunit type 1 TsaE [Leptolyngbya sp. PCC 6406]|uniref:tRNA (adenosine(37)-N6)-threonylcarbamoyltransferase complex ATPase subunit type 1 TsaE n=1 Tax=Leptolyngbya sp. PCC 6406 TaxID=1173264 RepID=UPI0021F1E143|nr:tRNA (adenosine(37)-N6)-threonylcarbamoyltransferase complex ATPase subunit type 1 TsaE [Leptolyngbya sp. PCC 6406]